MRNSAVLQALFPKIRAGVLSAALLEPDRWWFLTELARHLGVRPSSLQRELESLTRTGLLLRRKDGRRTYFKANADAPIFPELRGLIGKTAGIEPILQDALKTFGGRIELALLHGSAARGQEHAGSDVDLMIVGTVRHIDLVPVLRKLETRFRREINITLFSPEEFHRRRPLDDHFLRAIREEGPLFLKGTAHELEGAAPRT